MIIAKTRNNQWYIYDTDIGKIHLESDIYSEILEEWRELGFSKPEFADTLTLSKYFDETEESWKSNFQHEMFFSSVFVMFICLVVSFLLIIVGGIIIVLQRFNKIKKKRNLRYFFVYPQSIFFILVLVVFY